MRDHNAGCTLTVAEGFKGGIELEGGECNTRRENFAVTLCIFERFDRNFCAFAPKFACRLRFT